MRDINAFEQLSDEQLCLLVKKHNTHAESAFYERFDTLVSFIIRPFYIAGYGKEDLFQEGMVALFDAAREFNPNSGVLFRTFASRCIKNRIISVLTKTLGNKQIPVDKYIYSDSIDQFISSGSSDPERLFLDKEHNKELSRALLSVLSSYEIDVLQMFLDGYSYSAIAKSLGKTVKSVDSAVYRIRQKLYKHFFGVSR